MTAVGVVAEEAGAVGVGGELFAEVHVPAGIVFEEEGGG